jgi:hypothetical protein
MPRIIPSLAKNATREQINAYHRRYRKRNLSKLREYGRMKMREYRARDRREPLQRQA